MWTPEDWYREGREEVGKSPEMCRASAEHLLRMLQLRMPGKSREEIGSILAAWNRKRLDAVPDLKRFPELRGLREMIEARWRGIRDGGGFDDAQLAAYVDCNAYYHRHLAAKLAPAPATGSAKCSYAYFADSDHGPLLANNLDSSPEEPFGAPHWPMINEHLIWGGVSSGVFMDEQSPEIFPVPVSKLVARYCRSVAEAVEMVDRYKDFWGPGNVILIDRENRIAMIEKSARRIGVRRTDDGFGFITAMTSEEPNFRAYLEDRRNASLAARNLKAPCDDTVYWGEADHRRNLMKQLMAEARQRPTLESLRAMMQHRSPRGRVCYHGDRFRPDGPQSEFTLRTTVWALRERRALWWPIRGDKPSFEAKPEETTFETGWRWD